MLSPCTGKRNCRPPAIQPAAVVGQCAASDEAVQVEMGPQPLVPGVQEEREAHPAAQVALAERQERLGGGIEQQP